MTDESNAVIRLATESDAAAIQAIYAPVVRDTAISFEVDVPSVGEMRERIVTLSARFPWLVHERAGEVTGYVYASPHRTRAAYQWSVDTTVYIHEAARRGGIGRALYTSLLQILKLQRFFRAYAGITLPNPGSVGVHEAVGFRPLCVYRDVGYKLGAWYDVGWWEYEIQPVVADPGEPRPLPTIVDSVHWKDALAAGLRSR